MRTRYGYCTGFAWSMTGPVSYPLLEDILAAGYDYVEFPLMQIAALSGPDFTTLVHWLERNGLSADCACNMFPPSVRLTGPDADPAQTTAYLEPALERLARLGTRTIVLGSSGARDLPSDLSEEQGYRQMTSLLNTTVIPLLEQYGMTVAIEPISRYEANFICTLSDGMKLVDQVDHPRVCLLADTIHMLREQESPSQLVRYRPWLHHVHISELDRVLPVAGYSSALTALLLALRRAGATSTVSFETTATSQADMAQALIRLRSVLESA